MEPYLAKSAHIFLTDLPISLLNTHADGDHVAGNVQFETFYMHPAEEPNYRRGNRTGTLIPVQEGDVLDLGGRRLEIIHLPGHTPGSVCLHFEGEGLLLTGDTLFAGSCGRTDFPGGSMKEMSASLKRLAALPPSTKVVPGHGSSTTIARELETNPFMQ